MFEFLKSISAKNPNASRGSDKPPVSVRERVSALRHLPAFLKLIWHTSPALALANIALRLLWAGLPLGRRAHPRLVQPLPPLAHPLGKEIGLRTWKAITLIFNNLLFQNEAYNVLKINML